MNDRSDYCVYLRLVQLQVFTDFLVQHLPCVYHVIFILKLFLVLPPALRAAPFQVLLPVSGHLPLPE